jgi:hypothetical protein
VGDAPDGSVAGLQWRLIRVGRIWRFKPWFSMRFSPTDVANLFCSPWDDGGQQWWLMLVKRFGPSSVSMSAVFGAPLAKMKAPLWASVFDEAPGAVDLALGSR